MKHLTFFQSVCQQVNDIPMTEILKQKGIQVWDEHTPNAKALCPFHGDKTLGSFVVTNHKKIYKCFACDAGGGSVLKLIGDLTKDRCTFQEAIMETALAFQLITPEQWEWFLAKPLNPEQISTIQQRYYERRPKVEIQRATREHRHRIYEVFRTTYGRKGEPQSPIPELSPLHYRYLREERHLSEGDIRQGGYFTMPSQQSFFEFAKALMTAEIIPKGLVKETDLSCLKGVPGFYQSRDTKWWHYVEGAGIGIPIRDVKGQILGIQIRYDEVKEGQARYRWFTSAYFNDQHTTYQSGVSPGSPVDAFYPASTPNRTLLITEGRFKAQQLTKTFESVAFSVQGIQSWRGLPKEIESYLRQSVSPTPTHLYVAFDADLVYNPHVFQAAHEMIESLKQQFSDFYYGYLCWDEQWGKGIDDLLISGHQDQLQYFDWEDFKMRYEDYRLAIETQFGLETPQDWRDLNPVHLRNWFQSYVLY